VKREDAERARSGERTESAAYGHIAWPRKVFESEGAHHGKCEPITGVWRQSPQQGLEAELLVRRRGSPKTEIRLAVGRSMEAANLPIHFCEIWKRRKPHVVSRKGPSHHACPPTFIRAPHPYISHQLLSLVIVTPNRRLLLSSLPSPSVKRIKYTVVPLDL